MRWKHNGRQVHIQATAEIPKAYRPGRQYSGIVQWALSQLEPWEGKRGMVTVKLKERIPRIIVPVDGRPLYWGVHEMHRAHHPKPSPFVVGPSGRTRFLTVVVNGSIEKFRVGRIAPGETLPPPLPWQRSARDRQEECMEFWLTHAYVLSEDAIVPGTLCKP